jgi:hypothetical protein
MRRALITATLTSYQTIAPERKKKKKMQLKAIWLALAALDSSPTKYKARSQHAEDDRNVKR